MSRKKVKAFDYDIVLGIDFYPKMVLFLDNLKIKSSSKVLGVTFNHRLYDLNNKTTLKI